MNRRLFLTWLMLQANSRHSLPTFVDISEESGVHFKNEASHTSEKYLPETMGGGAAMLDYDGDGNPDLLFVNGAALSDLMPPGKLPD